MAVMAMIGTTSKTIVEVACGVGFESKCVMQVGGAKRPCVLTHKVPCPPARPTWSSTLAGMLS